MRSRRKTIVAILVAVIALAMARYLCYLEETNEDKVVVLDLYYIFDTDTILDSIAKGETNAFMQVAAPSDSSASSKIHWKQDDYLRLAQALHQLVWGEPLNEAEINSIYFTLNCKDATNGLQNAKFKFIKTMELGQGEARLERNMFFEPSDSYVNVWEEKYYPNLSRLNTVDLAKIKVSADDALRITEENGGSVERAKTGDVCFISIGLFPDSVNYRGWRVSYGNYSGTLFSLWIDPFAGEIRK